ncbi:MAG: DUF1249 domain-containing protein [Gammaproteobacteria bacterium]
MRPDLPIASDSWLRASWRARPGSFVALMSLYESNRVRVGALLGDLRSRQGRYLSRVPGECPLELVVLEQGAYTTVLALNSLFPETERGESDEPLRLPDLEVRVYHDAALAEASRLGAPRSHPALGPVDARLPAALDIRWRRNILLNKWLEYLADTGHAPGTFHVAD